MPDGLGLCQELTPRQSGVVCAGLCGQGRGCIRQGRSLCWGALCGLRTRPFKPWTPQTVHVSSLLTSHIPALPCRACCVNSKWQHATLLELVALPMLPYLTWSIGYYLKIFVVSAEKIK